MTVFLRIVFCFLCLTFVSAAYADDGGLIKSEQQVQAAYNAAVAIVKAQKPELLMALQKEQDDWIDFRDKECKTEAAELPKKEDHVAAEEFCKANMNRKRARILQGQPPNGKKAGASF
jgi:uncharacterized protein YecT (DUF1311 family)